jgi:DNA-binding IclR family transcriptional regulator
MGDALSAAASPRRDSIRSLVRGLKLLETVNEHPDLGFMELCRTTGLSEGAAFRMLRTLLDMGLVKLDAQTRTYSVARRVMTLSHGYDSEGWVSAVAWPRLRQLGHEIDWPVSLLMLSGAHVLVRATTDQFSQMVFGVSRAGVQLPILGSCSGMTLLAHLPPVEQAARLALLETTTQRALLASRSREDWRGLLGQIRDNGWWGRVQTETRQSFVSFPVKLDDEAVLAAITIKYFTSAMKPEDAASRYGHAVRAAAADIAAGYLSWSQDMGLEGEA